ncbi:MAG: metallophosphoesterase [Dokdonella sp.]
MRTLVHLSDLHFGRVDHAVIRPLIERINLIAPDLVAVSGDLTQRARSAQFRQAREFLDALPSPRIVVPGNHDVPLHNVLKRLLQPLEKYRRYITDDLEPFFVDDEIAVLGINTARSLMIKGGHINQTQLGRARAQFSQLPAAATKIVVTHHPLDLPEGHSDKHLVGRARTAMETFADCAIDILLAGHMHVAQTGNTAARYEIAAHAALVIHAGTATSKRRRGEANSFNVIRIDRPNIVVERWVWNPAATTFAANAPEHFRLVAGQWNAHGGGNDQI